MSSILSHPVSFGSISETMEDREFRFHMVPSSQMTLVVEKINPDSVILVDTAI
jgi:hypothetical protein